MFGQRRPPQLARLAPAPHGPRRQAGPLPGLVLGAGAPLARRGGRVGEFQGELSVPPRLADDGSDAASDFTPPQQARGTAARARRLLCPE